MRRFSSLLALSGVLALTSSLVAVSPVTAGASTTLHATSVQYPSTVLASVPLVRITYNQAVTATSLPKLRLSPAVATIWQQVGPNTVQAMASGYLVPNMRYATTIPTALSCSSSCTATTTVPKTLVASGSLTWMDQLFAQLNYLPVSFSTNVKRTSLANPVAGTFAWRFAKLPGALKVLWHVGTYNVILKGAIMRFQDIHGFATTGLPTAQTWQMLLHDASLAKHNPNPWNYVSVSKARPESLTLYVNGDVAYKTLVNTGIPQAQTDNGTYPVYLRFRTTTMSGTNPDGSKYHDTGIPYVSYFNGGDALHGFIRYSYGYPQSLGCVEMMYTHAGLVWPHTPIGTLVTVS